MLLSFTLIIFLRLLTAHIVADFFLQRYQWIAQKRKGLHSSSLYYHVAIVGILTYLLLGDWYQWQLPLFIMITHFFIDWWKSTQPVNTRNFIIDQVLHILMLIVGWLLYLGARPADIAAAYHSVNTVTFWIMLSSYLFITRPIGFFIAKATSQWQKELNESQNAGLTSAGTWIGYLERIIILTIFLIGQYSAIGFLIAAKSIFRFSGKVTSAEGRKQAEYILIGTLMSFLLAILVGITARFVMQF